jgi:hypothetical protein
MSEIHRSVRLENSSGFIDLDGLRTLVEETSSWNGACHVYVSEAVSDPDSRPSITVHES